MRIKRQFGNLSGSSDQLKHPEMKFMNTKFMGYFRCRKVKVQSIYDNNLLLVFSAIKMAVYFILDCFYSIVNFSSHITNRKNKEKLISEYAYEVTRSMRSSKIPIEQYGACTAVLGSYFTVIQVGDLRPYF